MKFKQEKVSAKGKWTNWINPKMTGYHMACCDCGLVHTINFRVFKIEKQHKNGRKEVILLPKSKYGVDMKVRRNEKYTKQLRNEKK